MRRKQNFCVSSFAGIAAILMSVAPAHSIIIGTGTFTPANIADFENTVTDFSVFVGPNNTTGSLTIDGVGTTLGVERFFVGQNAGADGILNITGGAAVTIERPISERFPGINIAPLDATATGRVNVDGATVLVRGSQAFTNVGRKGDGGLEVLNGATYTLESIDDSDGAGTNAFFNIGRDDGAVGNMRVSGAGSTVALSGTGGTGNSSFINVGRDGGADGTLLIEAGGKILNNDAQGRTVIGREIGSIGAVTVTGAGSELLAGRDLFVGLDVDDATGVLVGNGGTGTLTVESGGLVRSSTIQIGQLGTLTVTNGNVQSNITATGGGNVVVSDRFTIGDSGENETVNINSGSSLEALGVLRIGRGAGGIGTLNVDGAGTTLNAASNPQVGVGSGSSGTFNVTGGAAVTVDRNVVDGPSGLNITSGSGSNIIARATVEGPGTTVFIRGDRAFTNVGRNGDGGLEVLDGATYTLESINDAGGAGTSAQITVGRDDGGIGNLRVSGAGSEVSLSGTAQASVLTVGRDDGASGTLLIEAGGKLLNNDAQGLTVIGREIGSIGAVTVAGAGSELLAGQNLFLGHDVSGGVIVGNGGTGTLTVADGGLVTAGTIHVGDGGLVTGAGGQIVGDVIVSEGGIFAPGSSPGVFTINGIVTAETGAIIQIEIGNDAANSDFIDVVGTLIFEDGVVLELVFADDFDLSAPPIDIADFFSSNVDLSNEDFEVALFSDDPLFDVTDLIDTASLGTNSVIADLVLGTDQVSTVNILNQQVPEPGTLALFGIGFVGLGLIRRRRKAA